MGVVDRHRSARDMPAAEAAAPAGASTPAADPAASLPGWYDARAATLSPGTAEALLRLRRDILSGRLPPGAPLALRPLADRYGAPAGALREALALLSGAGLALPDGARDFRVAPASRADLVDVAQSRRRLETMALALSIRRGDALWRRQVGRTLRALAEAAARADAEGPVGDDWEARHCSFHFALISACGSPALLGFCTQLHDRFDRYRRLAATSMATTAAGGADHEAIANAALGGAVAHAVALLDRHIAQMAALVLGSYVARTG
ncbi:MAG TPA: FCD domain-containing protein [Alphaproteobacteria bacterium]|jgi:DNA-binding GntR family transcriptional regulator|nr:FCD domain-containing protein [Alphaproteobacteria bacterium]